MCRPNLACALLTLVTVLGPMQAQDTVRRVTQAEALKAARNKTQMDYPPMARQLRIEGQVDIEVTISPTGSVEDVKILTGNPALTGAAANAVRRWRFQPFTADGKTVRAVAVISFSFKL